VEKEIALFSTKKNRKRLFWRGKNNFEMISIVRRKRGKKLILADKKNHFQ